MPMDQCTYEKGLKSKIVERGLCCRCGTCGAVCPKTRNMRRFNPLMSNPMLGLDEGSKEKCSLCLDVCPIENRGINDGIGNIVSVLRARATDPTIRKRSQDGGACTAFLRSLDEHTTIGVGRDGGLPRPVLNDPMRSIGTVYGATSSLSVLDGKKRNVAFVGLPCQMTGILLSQRKGLLKAIDLKIGLFCTKNFYHRCMEQVLEKEGYKVRNIERMDIRSQLFVTMNNGEKSSLPISRFDECVLGGCKVCQDFCAYDSDIAFGSVGTGSGHTTVIIRNDNAKRLFDGAIEGGYLKADDKVNIDEIYRSQEKKRLQNG